MLASIPWLWLLVGALLGMYVVPRVRDKLGV